VDDPANWINLGTLFVLVITGIIVGLYTKYTYGLWRQTIDPIIIIKLCRDREKHRTIVQAENLGHGIAFNVALEPFHVHTLDIRKTFTFECDDIDMIKPGCTETFNSRQLVDGEDKGSASISLDYAIAHEIEFKLEYCNMRGKIIKSRIKMIEGADGDKVRILKYDGIRIPVPKLKDKTLKDDLYRKLYLPIQRKIWQRKHNGEQGK